MQNINVLNCVFFKKREETGGGNNLKTNSQFNIIVVDVQNQAQLESQLVPSKMKDCIFLTKLKHSTRRVRWREIKAQ